MGGSLTATSEIGVGSTFSFDVILQSSKPIERPAFKKFPIENMRVLIVDDNETNRLILDEMITINGMRTSLASDGESGLSAMREAATEKDPFQLVLLDLMMPGMDGAEVLSKIKDDLTLKKTNVILLSSSVRLPKTKDVPLLIKPVKQSKLLEIIKTTSRQPIREPKPQYSHSRKLKILVADDVLTNMIFVNHTISKMGHDVSTCENGQEAIDAAKIVKFDIIFMYIQIPEVDGFDATKAIRKRDEENGNHTLIIALTAHATHVSRQKCLDAGMDEYLSKPIRKEGLVKIINQFYPGA